MRGDLEVDKIIRSLLINQSHLADMLKITISNVFEYPCNGLDSMISNNEKILEELDKIDKKK